MQHMGRCEGCLVGVALDVEEGCSVLEGVLPLSLSGTTNTIAFAVQP